MIQMYLLTDHHYWVQKIELNPRQCSPSKLPVYSAIKWTLELNDKLLLFRLLLSLLSSSSSSALFLLLLLLTICNWEFCWNISFDASQAVFCQAKRKLFCLAKKTQTFLFKCGTMLQLKFGNAQKLPIQNFFNKSTVLISGQTLFFFPNKGINLPDWRLKCYHIRQKNPWQSNILPRSLSE